MKVLNLYSIKIRLIILAALGLAGMLIIAAESLMQTNDVLLSEKKQQTKHLVEAAHSIIESHYNAFKAGELTEDEAKKMAIKAVMLVRYDNGNYFWINDEKAVMVAHAVKPALNGKDLSKLTDPNGKFIFTEFVKLIKTTPEGGVVDYLWGKPGSDSPVGKVSYVKGFTPWGWIIGTGIYIDDIESAMWSVVNELLVNAVIIALLIIILSFFISKSVITPIKKTTEALADLAQGQGDLTQRLPVNGKDEIAHLSQSFNEFMIKVHNIISQVQDSAIEVKNTSMKLSSSSAKS